MAIANLDHLDSRRSNAVVISIAVNAVQDYFVLHALSVR